jgi:hypothetical protein
MIRAGSPLRLALALVVTPAIATACGAAVVSSPPSTARAETRIAPRPVRLGETFDLAAGDPVRVEGGESTLTFARVVEDSRCPPEVNCVWAGRAVVEVEVTSGRRSPRRETVRLEVGAAASEVAGGALRLAAVALEPHPHLRVETRPEDYRLRLALAGRR